MKNDQPTISDAEWEELQTRGRLIQPHEAYQILVRIFESGGRIPTPVDDGFSGWFARVMMPDVEQLMHARAFSGGEFWQSFLSELRKGAEKAETERDVA